MDPAELKRLTDRVDRAEEVVASVSRERRRRWAYDARDTVRCAPAHWNPETGYYRKDGSPGVFYAMPLHLPGQTEEHLQRAVDWHKEQLELEDRGIDLYGMRKVSPAVAGFLLKLPEEKRPVLKRWSKEVIGCSMEVGNEGGVGISLHVRSVRRLLLTLAHEMCHQWQYVNGVHNYREQELGAREYEQEVSEHFGLS